MEWASSELAKVFSLTPDRFPFPIAINSATDTSPLVSVSFLGVKYSPMNEPPTEIAFVEDTLDMAAAKMLDFVLKGNVFVFNNNGPMFLIRRNTAAPILIAYHQGRWTRLATCRIQSGLLALKAK
jgi:hypothetical protein